MSDAWMKNMAARLMCCALSLFALSCASEKPLHLKKRASITREAAANGFPKSFALGFATIGYQSEGTRCTDGSRVRSNWCDWEDMGKVPGLRNDRGNGFYSDYEADLDRAKSLGADSFSYGIDWARLEPERGKFDQREIDRVVAIVKAIRARGMKPLVVLFHWVTPAWVASPKDGNDLLARQDQAFVDAFLPVVDRIVPPLAGLVDDWVTLEEPFSIVGGQYIAAIHPPGHTMDFTSARRALVNLMYLNARVYRRVKQLDTQDADGDGVSAFVGVENLTFEVTPVDPRDPGHVAAAKRWDYILNHQFFTGVWNGDIDVDFDGKAATLTTDPSERHVPELERTLDFIGLNYYGRCRVEPGVYRFVPPLYGTPHFDVREYDARLPHSDAYLEISADGLRKELDDYRKRYPVPLIITESGDPDASDKQRPYFLIDHLRVLQQAIADGVDVRGFYYWTITDNYEWADGFASKEGLFRVDFSKPSLPKTRTRSADLFSAIAHARRIDDALWREWSLPQYPTGVP